MKFLAIVTLCGLYQGSVDTCIVGKDRTPQATRAACVARGQVLLKSAKLLAWYARIKEPHSTKIKCLEGGKANAR